MFCLAIALYTLLSGALFSALLFRRNFPAFAVGTASALCGSLIVLALSLYSIFFRYSFYGTVPFINTVFAIDSFRAMFIFPIALLGFAGAIHSIRYIGSKPQHGITGIYFFAFNLTVAAMLCCATIVTPVSFLLAWEIMGLASFMLVYFDFRNRGVDRASWIYLLSCEAGGLLLMFAISRMNGTALDGTASVICAMLGFGLKAGFPVLHVWLPKAHPAAPAPVSALMSGAMVNLGVLGIVMFCGTSRAEIGWVMGILGFAGTVTGIMFSLTKRNIKAVLAYSTVENCGIICAGVGCGILGGVYKLPGLEVFGYLAAFMHLINHASLKGSLFLGAGSVFKATGSLDADKLGGVIRKMPSTGKMFIFSSLGLAGLPPFNAFISELILYIALFSGLSAAGSIPMTIFCAAGIIILGASGAFALASLVRISAGVFLGEPRDIQISENSAKEDPVMGRAVFIALVPALVITLVPVWITTLVFEASSVLLTVSAELQATALQKISDILASLCRMNWLLLALALFVFAAAKIGRRKHKVLSGPTWDCGYARPTGRMQYTASALVQNITDFFSPVFGIAVRRRGDALSNEQGSDIADRLFWNFLFKTTARWSERIHKFQTGYLHFYILVMVSAIAALLVWAYFSGGVK